MQHIVNAPPHEHPRKHLDGVRQFNRAIFNKVVLTFAGKRVYGVVEHQGRKSGRWYRTPVVSVNTLDGFVIPLPYGIDTDWYLNVRAAGSCRLLVHGIPYEMANPEVITPEEALHYFGGIQGALLKLFGVPRYLRLRTVDMVE